MIELLLEIWKEFEDIYLRVYQSRKTRNDLLKAIAEQRMGRFHTGKDRGRRPQVGDAGKFLRIDLFQFDRRRVRGRIERCKKLCLLARKALEPVIDIRGQFEYLLVDACKDQQGRFERLISLEHFPDHAQPLQHLAKSRQYQREFGMPGVHVAVIPDRPDQFFGQIFFALALGVLDQPGECRQLAKPAGEHICPRLPVAAVLCVRIYDALAQERRFAKHAAEVSQLGQCNAAACRIRAAEQTRIQHRAALQRGMNEPEFFRRITVRRVAEGLVPGREKTLEPREPNSEFDQQLITVDRRRAFSRAFCRGRVGFRTDL